MRDIELQQRDQELSEQGKIELPLEIDKDRYIFIFKLKHIIYTLPFFIISGIFVFFVYQTDIINPPLYFYLFSFLPAILLFTFLQFDSSYGRKNINLINEIYYGYQFRKQKRQFIYNKDFNVKNKGDYMNDIRSILGIYDITNDCFETNDDRLVKVIEVSSINLQTLSEREEQRVYKSFETFLNNLDDEFLPMQFMIYAKPISLQDYINECENKTKNNSDVKSRLMAESYIDYTNDIQKNRNMVSRNRFIAIDVAYTNIDSFDELEKKALRLKSKIENMLVGNIKLNAKVLDNTDLHELQHTVIDYEGSQSDNINRDFNTDISLSEEEYNEAIEEYQEEKAKRIHI